MHSKQQVLDYIAANAGPDIMLICEHIADHGDPDSREILAAYWDRLDSGDDEEDES